MLRNGGLLSLGVFFSRNLKTPKSRLKDCNPDLPIYTPLFTPTTHQLKYPDLQGWKQQEKADGSRNQR